MELVARVGRANFFNISKQSGGDLRNHGTHGKSWLGQLCPTFPRLPNNQLENAGSSQKSWNLQLRNIYEICIKSWPGQRFPKFALLNWQKSGQKFTTCKGGGPRCCFEILEFVAKVGQSNFFHDFLLDFVEKVSCATFFEERS